MKKYRTQIVIWSDVGHTPITKRKGAYADMLYRNEHAECSDPEEARLLLIDLMQKTEHSSQGFFYVRDYPNQNTRMDFVRKEFA